MPLTDEQKQALGLLKSADAKEFAEALKETAQPLFQEVHNRGFKTAEDRWKPRAETAEQKHTELEQKVTTLEGEKRELFEKQPDVKKLNDDWTAKLATAETKHKTELETERGKVAKERTARIRADLITALTAQGLDPLYVETAVEKHIARLRTKDDGALELLEGSTEIPVQLAQGVTPVQHLAAEVRKGADPRWVLSGADNGGGTGAAGAGTGDGYDPVAAGKAAAKQQKAEGASTSLAFK
jgi:hypothetical protein